MFINKTKKTKPIDMDSKLKEYVIKNYDNESLTENVKNYFAELTQNRNVISDVLSTQEITFALADATPNDGVLWFTAGAANAAARTLKIIPTITIAGEDVTAEALASTTNPIVWNIELFINGIKVPGCTFTTAEFTIPQSVNYQDVYTLHVQATYNGMSYDNEFTVYGYDPS